MNVKLYTAETLDRINWPNTPDGDYARRYLSAVFENGIDSLIQNVRAQLLMLQAKEVVLPLSLNRPNPLNSYVVSPYNHYFAYGLEELDKLESPVLERLLKGALAPLCWGYRRSRFDEALYVNNWLLSTNLYPALAREQIHVISAFLIDTFTDVPIVFRSVDALGNPALYNTLLELGYAMVFARQVYYQNPHAPEFWRRKQLKVDLGKYRNSPYRLLGHDEIPLSSSGRLKQLYDLLYLEKYSRFNPQLTVKFLRLALEKRLLTLRAFERRGRIDAVLGYFTRNGRMTQPLFGYDTRLQRSLGLYRLLSLQVLLEGQKNGCLINASAGVGGFKRLRGGVPVIEYNAVYDRHLPAQRRLPWRVLKYVLDRVGVPIIQKYGF